MDDVRESFISTATTRSGPPLEILIRSSFSIRRRHLAFFKLTYGIRMQESVRKSLGPILQIWTEEILKTLEAHFHASGIEKPTSEASILFSAIDGISQHYALDPKHYPLDSVVDLLVHKYAHVSASHKKNGLAASVVAGKIKKRKNSKSGKNNEGQRLPRKKTKTLMGTHLAAIL